MNTLTLHHHGAVDGVTGSCHELRLGQDFGMLVDCGLFQGAETAGAGRNGDLRIDFPIDHIKALVVTHVHIDHVGRIPYLLAAGFKGPILCSQPSAHLLPLVLEDAVQLGFTRDPDLVMRFLALLKKRLIALPYRHWFTLLDTPRHKVRLRLQPAGHILGSAYVECDVQAPAQAQQTAQAQQIAQPQQIAQAQQTAQAQQIAQAQQTAQAEQALESPEQTQDLPVQEQPTTRAQMAAPQQAMRVQPHARPAMQTRRIVFSGDLGATYSPLLPAPKAPYRCDTLIIESTYGDRNHPDRRTRRALLKAVVEKALADQGVVLIPAFSIGRTQEILYEIEAIIAQEKRRAAARAAGEAKVQADGKNAGRHARSGNKRRGVDWTELGIIVDSPLASRFTESYRYLKPFWDKEALKVLRSGRDPLDFEQLITVGSHHEHEAMVRHLKQTNRGCVVIAASGMCAGGRIVNYLKALIEEPRTDIVLVGYQARGTPGRDILDYAGGGKGGHANGRAIHSGDARYTSGRPDDARRANGREPYVILDGERYVIRAGVHQLSGYSAHADQGNLLNFVKRMRQPPRRNPPGPRRRRRQANPAAPLQPVVPKHPSVDSRCRLRVIRRTVLGDSPDAAGAGAPPGLEQGLGCGCPVFEPLRRCPPPALHRVNLLRPLEPDRSIRGRSKFSFVVQPPRLAAARFAVLDLDLPCSNPGVAVPTPLAVQPLCSAPAPPRL